MEAQPSVWITAAFATVIIPTVRVAIAILLAIFDTKSLQKGRGSTIPEKYGKNNYNYLKFDANNG